MDTVGKLLDTPLNSATSVVERVINQITKAIISGELKPGDQIPTELALAGSLQVARNSVREAIKVLSHFGVLEIRRAEGTFVSSAFNNKMLDPMLYGLILQRDSAKDILELREVFDIGILKVVIESRTEQSIVVIREAYGQLERALLGDGIAPESILDRDLAFHSAINSCIHNKLITEIAGYIDRITIPSRVLTMKMILSENHQQEYLNLHLGIVQMIEKRETEQVMKVVQDHYQFWKIVQK